MGLFSNLFGKKEKPLEPAKERLEDFFKHKGHIRYELKWGQL